MFRCFFPRPKAFFISAFLWSVLCIIIWLGYAQELPSQFSGLTQYAQKPLDNNIFRFFHITQLWFYLYYWFAVAIIAVSWQLVAPHPWQRWSVWGTALIIFTTWFNVQVGVAINAWYGPFYDMIQSALSKRGSVAISSLYLQLTYFLSIALIALIINVLSSFFVSHWIFRWRTAMNNYYIANWQQLRHIEGASQRVQEDTMRFARTLEGWGIGSITSIMTLIAFLPVLASLSHHVTSIPILGSVPYALVIIAIIWSLFGTALLALFGIKLPGLEFRNQRVEAAYRKELVYGEDHADRATPPQIKELYHQLRHNYFRLYFHYLYFNIARVLYLQVDNIFGLIILLPAIVAGSLTLGLLNQITNVFDQVRSSFQYLITSWSTLIELMSIYKRLNSFEQILQNKTHEEISAESR